MPDAADFAGPDVGYDVPARPGMREADIETPCLVLDLDALERNILKMGDYARQHAIRHRAHGKMHKSVDVAKLQIELGGAVGVCCQKVSEAEVFVRGGVGDVLVSNEVRGFAKIDRLARLPRFGAKISVCVDDLDTVSELSEAAARHGTTLGCLVEIDCGAGRCGVATVDAALAIAQAIAAAPHLVFEGIQAYQGRLQHLATHAERAAQFAVALDLTRATVDVLTRNGLTVATISGGGTGSFELETQSGLYTELQCGSYAFMDADYGRVRDADGRRLDEQAWENALFILTAIMSHPTADRAICDAGLKVQSVDSGLPVVFGRDDVRYVNCSDEHGVIDDSHGRLKVGDRLRLVPGHCDPTCNIHDWYVGVRNGIVECLWPVSARGKCY
ncbi:MAG: DSD1 family PLP-dependent enzyme [Ancalomicrobiaceae bacterium]|nr:DSD1 family PLP-dependent enzyme [Ancalomicrobiaceae bacterium]